MTNDLAIRILTGDVLGTTEQTHEAVAMAVKALSALPSADVVEVVRCNGCKHYRDYGCQRAFVYPKPDDFCSYGERADG